MKKQKIKLEYPMKTTSNKVLWDIISSPRYLSEWFADEVKFDQKEAQFRWGKNEVEDAIIETYNQGTEIKFRWKEDSNSKSYFQMKILKSEITEDYILQIIDFAESGEEEDMENLWNTLIQKIRNKYRA